MTSKYDGVPMIPIPDFFCKDRRKKQVILSFKKENGKRGQLVLGRLVNETMMQPNETFKNQCPELYKQHFGTGKIPPEIVSGGMYAAALGVGLRTGLYGSVQEAFGRVVGNAVMDYAMFMILSRSCTTSDFPQVMAEQVRFEGDLRNGSWHSRLFSDRITESGIHKFKRLWAMRCAAMGTKKVWLCVDGADADRADRAEQDAAPAASGKSKSVSRNTVGCLWAVDEETGAPVSWGAHQGGALDGCGVSEMTTFLRESGIEVEGVIVAPGAASQEMVEFLESHGMKYVVMLMSSRHGFREMVEKHLDDVRWNVRNALPFPGLFGVTDRVRLFESRTEENCVGLFFDATAGSIASARLLDKFHAELSAMREALKEDRPQQAADGFGRFLTLSRKSKDAPLKLEIDHEALQAAVNLQGVFAVGASEDLDADVIYRLCRLRDRSEEIFPTLNGDLGKKTLGVHSDASIQSKFAIAFVASIIRHQIREICLTKDLDTNEEIRRLNTVVFKRTNGDNYFFVETLAAKDWTLLKNLGVTPEHLRAMTAEVKKQFLGAMPEGLARDFHGFKEDLREEESVTVEAEAAEDQVKPVRKPGRPKGSKNKKTLEREAAMANQPPAPKRGRGRPKGSKNKKTLEREAAMAKMEERPVQGSPRLRKSSSHPKVLRTRQVGVPEVDPIETAIGVPDMKLGDSAVTTDGTVGKERLTPPSSDAHEPRESSEVYKLKP